MWEENQIRNKISGRRTPLVLADKIFGRWNPGSNLSMVNFPFLPLFSSFFTSRAQWHAWVGVRACHRMKSHTGWWDFSNNVCLITFVSNYVWERGANRIFQTIVSRNRLSLKLSIRFFWMRLRSLINKRHWMKNHTGWWDFSNNVCFMFNNFCF